MSAEIELGSCCKLTNNANHIVELTRFGREFSTSDSKLFKVHRVQLVEVTASP